MKKKIALLDNPDAVMKKYFLPKIEEITSNSRYIINKVSIIDSPVYNTEIMNKNVKAKRYEFMLEDKENPIAPGEINQPWHCRIRIEINVISYFLNIEYTLLFPEETSLNQLLEIIKNPYFVGLPPNLSFSPSADDVGLYKINFFYGSGNGWGLENYVGGANTVKSLISEIFCLNDIFESYLLKGRGKKEFNKLSDQLIKIFQSW